MATITRARTTRSKNKPAAQEGPETAAAEDHHTTTGPDTDFNTRPADWRPRAPGLAAAAASSTPCIAAMRPRVTRARRSGGSAANLGYFEGGRAYRNGKLLVDEGAK
ncbi:hypothetical protein P8C59_001021 [Phyllachora maydis]|uniref:Uncharacterized protein n=1 Tax=Phyllachora maydis TaxID=1825666 RepID=A0AAD9HYQ7_9PEZI|nr:hypothetical protein P8C59_001021 [Phyllachora maydis]